LEASGGVTVDPRAASGFADAVGANERGRPGYPTGVVKDLVRELGLNSASTVLDLAAGTGKLTRLLVTRVDRAIAVDASPAMLTEPRRRRPGVEALTGTATGCRWSTGPSMRRSSPRRPTGLGPRELGALDPALDPRQLDREPWRPSVGQRLTFVAAYVLPCPPNVALARGALGAS
jgi:hypothetical protein